MTGLPAEAHAVHVIHGAISKLPGNDGIGKRGDANKCQQPTEMWIAEVDRRKTQWKLSSRALATTLPCDPHRDEEQAKDENHGQREIRQDSEVWMPGFAA